MQEPLISLYTELPIWFILRPTKKFVTVRNSLGSYKRIKLDGSHGNQNSKCNLICNLFLPTKLLGDHV